MNQEVDLYILKSLITDKKLALDFVGECDTKIFNSEYWNFANIIFNYIKTYKSLPTLRVLEEKLHKNTNVHLLENVRKTWEQLSHIDSPLNEYPFNLEKIKKRYAEKQLINLKDSLGKQDPGSVDVPKSMVEIQKTMQSLKGLSGAKSYDRRTLKNSIASFSEKFNAKRANPKMDMGLMTGYSAIDFSTNGLKSADFMIIAGESGFGKSLFLNNIGVQIWLQKNNIDNFDFTEGKNVVYFSLEMPHEDCFNRLLSRLSGVPSRKLESPHTIDKEDLVKIKKAIEFIKKYPYEFEIIDIADACANDLDAILEDIQYNIDAIFIDYLGIMRTNEISKDQDWLNQATVAYQIRAIARKRNLPIFSAVQLNRKSQSKDTAENIGLSRLARSASIATHATHVIQIENRVQEENYPDFLYHIIK